MTESPKDKDASVGLVRSLWTLIKGPNRLTAGIYLHPFGHQLRIFHSDEPDHVVNSFVAKAGDPSLMTRADVLREVLEAHGWTLDSPNCAGRARQVPRLLSSVVTRRRGIASALAGLPMTAPAASGMTPTTSGVGTAAALPTQGTMSTTDATGTPFPTAPLGSATPGVISPPPAPVAPPPQQLGQLLCAVSGLSQSAAAPAQLASALNQVMLALHQ
jgi:hypothetical protein